MSTDTLGKKMNRFLSRLCLSLAIAGAFFAGAVPASADSIVATVNGKPIYESSVSLRAKQAGGSAPSAQARIAAMKQLALESLIDETVAPVLKANADLRAEFERQRRTNLLAFYYAQQTNAVKVTQSEIADFIRLHPQFFAGRKTYHFSEIHVAATDVGAAGELQRRILEVGRLGSIEPIRIEAVFGWAMNPSFQLSITKQWLGTEQMPDAIYRTLAGLEQGARKVSVICNPQDCTVFAFHAAYADPADPALLKEAISRNVLGAKRAAMIDSVNDALLQRADLRVNGKEAARTAFGSAAQSATFAAPARTRAIWVAQILNLCMAIAASVWFVRKSPRQLYRRSVVSPWLAATYGKEVSIPVAAGLTLVCGLASLYVFGISSIGDHISDLPLVIGFAVLLLLATGGVFRFSSAVRRLAYPRRVGVLLAIATEIVLIKLA